jgi:signal transduction histidine kinase
VQQGACAVVTVVDTGIGIGPDLLGRVFDLFEQADRTQGISHVGLAIGLTLVKRLVELHGGTVSADSEGAGMGSAFTVRLPLLDAAGAQASVARPPNAVSGAQLRA